MKYILAVSAATALLIIWLVGCDDRGDVFEFEEEFAVHEWGVLVGCQHDSVFFNTSRPEVATIAREPVIYLHNLPDAPVDVEVVFKTGQPTDTYPLAEISGDTLRWSPEKPQPQMEFLQRADTSNHVPLEYIVDILNDVDADMIQSGQDVARFLFYEGLIDYRNPIEVEVAWVDSSRATMRNTGDYTVYNVLGSFNYDIHGLGPFNPYLAYADSIGPGEAANVLMSPLFFHQFDTDLTGLGFTQSEAEAFQMLWGSAVYSSQPAVEAWASVMFRLPQSVCEDMIGLTVSPEPDVTLRALFALVHFHDQP